MSQTVQEITLLLIEQITARGKTTCATMHCVSFWWCSEWYPKVSQGHYKAFFILNISLIQEVFKVCRNSFVSKLGWRKFKVLLLRPVMRNSKSQFILECVDKWRTERRSFRPGHISLRKIWSRRSRTKLLYHPQYSPASPLFRWKV